MARRSKSTRSAVSKRRYRSAISGRYVTAKHGRRSKRTTVGESPPKRPGKRATGSVRYRSAISGRYVTPAHAKRSPRTTVQESK